MKLQCKTSIASLAFLALLAGGPIIAEDRSLPSADYVDLGVPAANEPWTGEQMDSAVTALTKLAETHPEQLPRYESKKSGKLFERITSRENLKPFGDKATAMADRFPDCLKYYGSSGKLLSLYVAAVQSKKADGDDLAELLGSQLRGTVVVLDIADEIVAGLKPTDADYKQRMAGLKQMRSGLGQVAGGCTESLGETDTYSLAARQRMIGYCRETYPALVPRLLPESQTEVLDELDKLIADPKLAGTKIAMTHLREQTAAAIDKAKP